MTNPDKVKPYPGEKQSHGPWICIPNFLLNLDVNFEIGGVNSSASLRCIQFPVVHYKVEEVHHICITVYRGSYPVIPEWTVKGTDSCIMCSDTDCMTEATRSFQTATICCETLAARTKGLYCFELNISKQS